VFALWGGNMLVMLTSIVVQVKPVPPLLYFTTCKKMN
jgi:hypothetical protein